MTLLKVLKVPYMMYRSARNKSKGKKKTENGKKKRHASFSRFFQGNGWVFFNIISRTRGKTHTQTISALVVQHPTFVENAFCRTDHAVCLGNHVSNISNIFTNYKLFNLPTQPTQRFPCPRKTRAVCSRAFFAFEFSCAKQQFQNYLEGMITLHSRVALFITPAHLTKT